MLATLGRLTLTTLAVLLVAFGATGIADRVERDRIDRAAQAQAQASAAYLRGYAAGSHARAPQAEALLRELAAQPLTSTETRIIVLPDRGRLIRGDRRILDDRWVALGPPFLPGQRVERVDTAAGPAWAIEVPVRSGTTVVGSYTTVHPMGAELRAQEQRLADTRSLMATVILAVAGLLTAVIVFPALVRRALAARRRRAPPRRPSGSVGSTDSARRPLAAVVVEGFASRLAFGVVTFALPLYAHRLGMSLASIGLLLSTNAGVALVLKPIMGAVIDRVGVRRAYVVAVILRSAVLLTLVVATGPAHLFAARALHGVSIAMRDPASATVLSALGGKAAVAQRFAWYQTVKSVAGSGGQFASGVLLTLLTGNFRIVFVIAATLSAVPLVVVLAGLRGPLVDRLRLPQPPRRTPMPRDLRRALLPYAGLGAFMTGTAYLMSNLLPILAVDYMGLAPAAASSLYLVKTVVSFTGPLWGWVSDRVSVRLVLGVRALGNGLSSVVWLVFPSYAGLLAGRMLDDVGKAAFAPAWGSVMAQVSALDPPRRARTLAMMSSAEDAGELAGPVVAGLVWSAFGLPALLILRAVLAVGAEVYAFALGRRVALPPRAGKEHVTNPPRPHHMVASGTMSGRRRDPSDGSA